MVRVGRAMVSRHYHEPKHYPYESRFHQSLFPPYPKHLYIIHIVPYIRKRSTRPFTPSSRSSHNTLLVLPLVSSTHSSLTLSSLKSCFRDKCIYISIKKKCLYQCIYYQIKCNSIDTNIKCHSIKRCIRKYVFRNVDIYVIKVQVISVVPSGSNGGNQ